MDKNNSRPQSQSGGGNGEPAVDGGDSRSQLKPDSRQRVTNKISSGSVIDHEASKKSKRQNAGSALDRELAENKGWYNAVKVEGEPAMDGGDWRSQLKPDFRQRITNRMFDDLKRHLPLSGQEGLLELKKIAARLEEKFFTAATSQYDYLRKITLEMLTVGTKSQNPIPYNPNGSISSASVNFEPSKKRKRQNEGYSDRFEATEAELIVAQKAWKASQEELRAVKDTLEMLTANVDLVEDRHIKLREAIVEKWMQSQAGKAYLAKVNVVGSSPAGPNGKELAST